MRVSVTGTLGVMSEAAFARLTGYIQKEVPGTEVDFLYDMPTTNEDIIKAAKGTNIIINQYQPMSEEIYKALAPELRGYVANGIGFNSAVVPVATQYGIPVANVPDYCQDEVATHAVSLIMACQRQLPNIARWIADGNWGGGYKAIVEIGRFEGKTLGLFGFGRIPRKVAEMMSGFGLRIIAHDPYIPDDAIREGGAEPVDFEKLITESDFISLHAPLVPSTEGIMNAEVFKKMKKNAVLINTARGGLVDPQALYDALVNKEIRFAGIDVLIAEPPAGIEKELIHLPNVIATPHVGYYSTDSMEELLVKVAQEAGRMLRGELPKNLVNKDVIPKLDWLKK